MSRRRAWFIFPRFDHIRCRLTARAQAVSICNPSGARRLRLRRFLSGVALCPSLRCARDSFDQSTRLTLPEPRTGRTRGHDRRTFFLPAPARPSHRGYRRRDSETSRRGNGRYPNGTATRFRFQCLVRIGAFIVLIIIRCRVTARRPEGRFDLCGFPRCEDRAVFLRGDFDRRSNFGKIGRDFIAPHIRCPSGQRLLRQAFVAAKSVASKTAILPSDGNHPSVAIQCD